MQTFDWSKEFTTRMTRFTFNRCSVSFELIGIPKEPPEYGARPKARVVRIRCDNAQVHFFHEGACMPSISTVVTEELTKGLHVVLEDYATIHCTNMLVRVDDVDLFELKNQSYWLWADSFSDRIFL